MSARAGKERESAGQEEKGQKCGPDYSPGSVQAKLHTSWASYVKGLGGGEQEYTTGGPESEHTGAGEEATTGGPPTEPLTENPDPTTIHDGKPYEPKYAKVGDQVFKGQPKHTDVQQGYLADCYLIAAMAAVAAQRPDIIESMIEDHGDGTVTVTLHKAEGGYLAPPGAGKPHKVRITTELPSKDGARACYARGADRQLWPGLIEKAYVALEKGGKYQGANTGGSAGKAMQAILGKPSKSWPTTSKPGKALLKEIKDLLDAKKPMVAGSLGKDAYEKDEALADLADAKRVYPWHAYTILRADPEKDEIELFNPWGTKHPEKLTAAEFQKLYTWVYQGNPMKAG